MMRSTHISVMLHTVQVASVLLCLRSMCSHVMFTAARSHDGYYTDGSDKRMRHGKYLPVTTVLVEPYVMKYNESYSPDGSPHYYGYLVDMLEKMTSLMQTKYRLSETRDGEFGFAVPGSSRWSGCIGDLLEKKADLAATPMYVTSLRQEVVDFSFPFLNVSASLVLRKYDDGRHSQITSLEDVYNQDNIVIGTQERGLIHRALRLSNNSLIRNIYDKMKRTQGAFTDTNEEGLKQVRNYDYAFLMPSRIAEYIINRRPCDLYIINTTFFQQQFAFATRKNSALLKFVNGALTVLRDNGEMDRIYRKWWIENGECSSDTRRHAPEKTMRYERVNSQSNSSLAWTIKNNYILVVVVLLFLNRNL